MFERQRNKKLNYALKGALIALWEEGKSKGQIANVLGISKSTVRHWVNRYGETGSVDRKAGSGRQRCTTPLEDMRIRRFVRENPITTASDILSK